MAAAKSTDPTKTQILEFCAAAFNEKGFRRLAMDEVAQQLKISKKTIYKHFRSKEEILQKVLNLQFTKLESRLKKALQKAKPMKEFMILANYFIDYMNRFSPQLRKEIEEDHPHLVEQLLLAEKRIFRRSFIKVAKERRSVDDIAYTIPTRELALGFFELVRGTASLPAENREYMVSTFVRGMRSAAARKRRRRNEAKK